MFYFDFDRDFYKFTRPIKDLNPYEVIKKDGKSIVVHNAIGIPKENIKVDIEKDRNSDYLVISGEFKNEITNKIYSFDTRFGIVADEVAGIEWYVKDGLVYVEVSFKEIQKPQVNIKYRN